MSTYYSLQGVYDSVQIFALILSSVGMNADENRFRQHNLTSAWQCAFRANVQKTRGVKFFSEQCKILYEISYFSCSDQVVKAKCSRVEHFRPHPVRNILRGFSARRAACGCVFPSRHK